MDRENDQNVYNVDDEDFLPPKPKKQRKTLAKRFGSISDDSATEVMKKGYVPENTKKSTSWAIGVFSERRAARNSTSSEKVCPANLFEEAKVDELNYWLPRFINEVRRQDWKFYPPRSIHQLLAGLQRHMLDHNYMAPKFMDRSNPSFRPVHGACDSVYRDLHSRGVGTSIRHTPVITDEEEEKLWTSGVFSIDNPKNLQRAVFYYIGKRFCIKGGEEMRKLGPSQFKRTHHPDCFTYIEHGSKNHAGRACDLRLRNKEVPCPAVPENKAKCLVFLLDLYLSKLPEYAFKEDVLFLKAKQKAPSDNDQAWYEKAPIGKNTLSKMVKEMCCDAGIDGKTNHSMRATGATMLFQNEIHERVIQTVTGHRSLDALRSYERISTKQHEEVSNVMMGCVRDSHFTSSSRTLDFSSIGINNCSIGQVNIKLDKLDSDS